MIMDFAMLMLATPAGGDGALDAATAATESLEVQSVWDFVRKGGMMMIPIGVCSLVALTVFMERLVSLRRGRVIPSGFTKGLDKVLANHPEDRDAALKFCAKNGSPVARIYAAGIKRLGGPVELVEKHIQEAGEREVIRLRRFLRVLSVIASVAPLMGLLGTILGMIDAFQTVASSSEALGRTELLAGGIYEAMITTAAGMFVAIPVLIGYHWLASRVERLVMDMDEMSMGFVESQVDVGAPVRFVPRLAKSNDAVNSKSDAKAASNAKAIDATESA